MTNNTPHRKTNRLQSVAIIIIIIIIIIINSTKVAFFVKVFSPLGQPHTSGSLLNRLPNKRNGISTSGRGQILSKTVKHQSQVPSPSVNIYLGENFSVRLHQYFLFEQLIEDMTVGGVVHCEFSPSRHVDKMVLSSEADRIMNVPNAGGNSVMSEVLSFELMCKCFQAKLVKTEMEVTYFPEGGSITDYVCEVFGSKVGVSVTRAMKFKGDYEEEDATHLLTKKLKGVIQSSRNTLEGWTKQILHLWAPSKHVANTVTKVYNALPGEITHNTVVVITTASQSNFIFANK